MQPWLQFEEEVRLLTELFGYTAARTPPAGDHGVDVIAEKNGRRVAIQVKLYQRGSVGNGPVLMLLGGMKVYQASEALLITTSKLTKKAAEACRAAGVVYYDGESLRELCVRKSITLPSWCILRDHASEFVFDVGREAVVGRDLQCSIRVETDEMISRRHCRIFRDRLQLVAEDLGSRNGTWINSVRIDRPTLLTYGSMIQVGRQRWLVDRPLY